MCQGGRTNWFYKTCLWIAAAAVPTVLLALFLGHGTLAAGTAVILFVAVALGIRGTPLRGLSFTMWITAAGRDNLLQIGVTLIFAAMLHSTLGYILGYWGSRMLGMNRLGSRTIAIEVGLQNGGLASGLALQMGKVATIGLAPAIFGPWMNISGSALANYWRTRPIASGPDRGRQEA